MKTDREKYGLKGSVKRVVAEAATFEEQAFDDQERLVAEHRQTFAYDEAGNKSEEVSYSVDGSVGKSIFTREYDEHGNWTKELHSTVSSWDEEFGLSTPAQVTRRTITYFT